MMEHLELLGGELRIQRGKRRDFLGRIDGSMSATSWERSSWDISLGKRDRKGLAYEQSVYEVSRFILVFLCNTDVYKVNLGQSCFDLKYICI